jgi:hypothetical protein
MFHFLFVVDFLARYKNSSVRMGKLLAHQEQTPAVGSALTRKPCTSRQPPHLFPAGWTCGEVRETHEQPGVKTVRETFLIGHLQEDSADREWSVAYLLVGRRPKGLEARRVERG